MFPSGKSWGRTHTHTHTHSPREGSQSYLEPQLSFSFRCKNLLTSLRRWRLLVAWPVVSQGLLGHLVPWNVPPPTGIRGFPGLPSFPSFQHLSVWRPKAGSDLGTDLGAKACCLHPHIGLLGVDQGTFQPPIGGGCHVLPPGEGGWFSPWGERPPLAPSKTDQKESFPGSPGPPAALSPTGPLPIPTACWWRG